MENLTATAVEPRRYHPLIVLLHWLIALTVAIQALIGVGILHFWPNTAVKIEPLTIHMILGIAMLIMMAAMIVARLLLPRPAAANESNSFLHFLSQATHFLLYLVSLLMGATGILLAVQSHVLQLVVGGKVGVPMYFPLFLHAAVFVVFGLLVSFHVLGALYHQFVLRDGLFARMGIARKEVGRLEGVGRTAASL